MSSTHYIIFKMWEPKLSLVITMSRGNLNHPELRNSGWVLEQQTTPPATAASLWTMDIPQGVCVMLVEGQMLRLSLGYNIFMVGVLLSMLDGLSTSQNISAVEIWCMHLISPQINSSVFSNASYGVHGHRIKRS